jgi:hypothetical protein
MGGKCDVMNSASNSAKAGNGLLTGGHTRRGGLPDSEMIMKDGRLD